MNLTFKQANQTHISTILEMMEEFYSIDHYPFDPQILSKNLSEFIANEQLGKIWMIQHDDLYVGYVILTFGFSFEYQGRDAFIDEIYIGENYRGKGIGKFTIEFVSKQALQFGVKALHLEVENRNKAGVNLYKNQGFDGNDRQLLTKKLTGYITNNF